MCTQFTTRHGGASVSCELDAPFWNDFALDTHSRSLTWFGAVVDLGEVVATPDNKGGF